MYEQQALCTFESAKLTYCGFTNMSFSTGSPTPWSNDGAYTEPYKPRCLKDQTKYYVLIKNSYSRMLVDTSVLRVCRHFRKSDGLNVHGANISNYYVSMYVNIVSETIKQRTLHTSSSCMCFFWILQAQEVKQFEKATEIQTWVNPKDIKPPLHQAGHDKGENHPLEALQQFPP